MVPGFRIYFTGIMSVVLWAS